LLANATILRLHVRVPTGASAVVPGVYPVTEWYVYAPGSNQATSDFAVLDAACKPAIATPAGTSGSITIATISSAEITGTFHITFETGDVLDGTFVAPTACASVPDEKTCLP
jgi:hypothetical protein